MSKSAMLRTRRRDVNVKPNRRLDRKSSRGMIYENEELRLRTININAEIERGQSDIKKLRRENEQLRKEIWCLRDEYEKLDKLLKEKEHDGATSCSSCTSDTDSCSSCSESEDNETSQNMENVQKTTLNSLRGEFDHLSVVTEETSADNSDKNSSGAAISPDAGAPPAPWDALPPDQSYPHCDTLSSSKSTLPLGQDHAPRHFFSPLKTSKSYENCNGNANLSASSWSLGTAVTPWTQFPSTPVPYVPYLAPAPLVPAKPLLPPAVKSNLLKHDLHPCKKTCPDILVKTDSSCSFPNYTQDSRCNSFANGGNLEELLQDIETISNDILNISSQAQTINEINVKPSVAGGGGKVPYVPNVKVDSFAAVLEEDEPLQADGKPYKSELSVVLMPKPMPLLGFDKYQNIKSSLESLEAIRKSVESIPTVLEQQTAEVMAPVQSAPTQAFTPQPFPTELLSFTPTPALEPPISPNSRPELVRQPSNPFFYGSFDNYQNADAFSKRYNPEVFAHDNFGFKTDLFQQSANKLDEKETDKANVKSNLENEIVENFKSNVSSDKEGTKNEKLGLDKVDEKKEVTKPNEDQKSPKSRRTRKVSIYFKGKKDKLARSLSLDTKLLHNDHADPLKSQTNDKSPLPDKKTTIDDRKNSAGLPKTSSTESKLSQYETNCLAKTEQAEKILNSDNKTSSDSKNSNYDRKHRKSSSTSPERKHVHVKLEDGKKCHKKRHRKSERRPPNNRRNSVSADRTRERSFSVCTDRSNILDHRFGHFEDYTNSERDRSNSLSSCDTIKSRKMSAVQQFQVSGKIPWFGCWGNGCL